MTIGLPKPTWTKRQQQILDVAKAQGFIHRDQIKAIIPSAYHMENVITKCIEYSYLIPDKSAFFEKKFSNGKVKTICQRYIYNRELDTNDK